ncbi:hypothetical protein [uncultured Ruegeria sp.]|uniref:hypothetical protein n=1 Tax=uncultured Ruegeria sp. TaxID=259304 RepID=UPI002604E7A8|nr:hypothetical protein [uncultured Ruegeria sp.]
MLRIAHYDDADGIERQLDGNLWADSSGKLLRIGDFNRARYGILADVLSARFTAKVEVVAFGHDRDDRIGLGCRFL